MSFAYINTRQFYFGGVGAARFEAASCWVCANKDNLTETVDYLLGGQSPGDLPPVQGLFLRGEFSDLSPLRQLTFPIANLRFEDHKIRKRDLENIYCLEHLGGLSLAATECGLDFSAFKNLGQFVGDWHENHINLNRCRHLRAIRVFRLNTKSNSLLELGGELPIDDLSIIKTNIETLAGIESFNEILSLSVSYAPRLRDISPLKMVQSTLRELELDHIKEIEDYGVLSFLSKLKQLKIIDSAEIPSLALLLSLDRLEILSVAGTRVNDGNFDLLLKLSRLRAVGFDDKRHYTKKSEALNRLLQSRLHVDIPL